MALIPTTAAPVDYRRKIAMELMQQGMDGAPIKHWTQGLAKLGQGALGGYEMYQADQKDKADDVEGAKAYMALLQNTPGASPAPAAAAPAQAPAPVPPASPAVPMAAPMGNKVVDALTPPPVTGPRPGGPVMPSAKVWGDQEAEAAGLYEPAAPNTKLASANPAAPIPSAPAQPAPSPVAQALAQQPQPAPAPQAVAQAEDPNRAKIIQLLSSDSPAARKMGKALADNYMASQFKVQQLEKLNESTLFDPRTGRTVPVPGAEKPIVVGKDQRLVKDGKIIIDQQPDKAVKITLSNGQEVTAIQNADGSFRIPEVRGAGSVTPKLSEGERDQIIKDEDTRAAGESALSAIREARKLNDKAFSGAGAGTRAWVARNSPVDLGIVSSGLSRDGGKATTQLDNLLTEQALGSMKAIFGGNPTEGERKVLLDLQASSSKSPEERKEILDRAEKMMARRIQLSGERANSIRGGSYFKPGGGNDAAPSQADALKQKYGLD